MYDTINARRGGGQMRWTTFVSMQGRQQKARVHGLRILTNDSSGFTFLAGWFDRSPPLSS